MDANVSNQTLLSVYQSVKMMMDSDKASEYKKSLQDMYDTYIVYGLDGSTEAHRSMVVEHYRRLEQLIAEIDALL